MNHHKFKCSNCGHTWSYDGSWQKDNRCFRCNSTRLSLPVPIQRITRVENQRYDLDSLGPKGPQTILAIFAILAFTLLAGVGVDLAEANIPNPYFLPIGFVWIIACISLAIISIASLNHEKKELIITQKPNKDLVPLTKLEVDCESPIEYQLYHALRSIGLEPRPQVQIGRYRVDFVINKVVIECDGHDFHSTKEQRTRDAKQSRYLTREGYTVLRFTGTEIHKNPSACAKEVQVILESNPLG